MERKLLLNDDEEATYKTLKYLVSKRCSVSHRYFGYLCTAIYITHIQKIHRHLRKDQVELFLLAWANKLIPNRKLPGTRSEFGMFGPAHFTESAETRYAFLLNIIWAIEDEYPYLKKKFS